MIESNKATHAEDMHVLVVDDSSVYRKLIADTLFYQPYTVHLAQTGREALELFEQIAPPIVITDWMLPDLSGLDICQRIRSDDGKPYTYLVLLTTMAEKEHVVKGLEAGADDYLTKPFDADELKARLGVARRIVGRYRELQSKVQSAE
jgi:two-component system, cell cycle response regulator